MALGTMNMKKVFFAGTAIVVAAVSTLAYAAGGGTGDYKMVHKHWHFNGCLLYTSPSPRDKRQSRMPSSA